MSDLVSADHIYSILSGVFADTGLAFNSAQMEKFVCHFQLLLKWNPKINLTSISDPEEIAWRHFAESLYLTQALQLASSESAHPVLMDVGSGAGFPGLPLKVAWESVSLKLIEPNQRKASFLKEVVRSCSLDRTEVLPARLEHIAKGNFRHTADVVVVRAVALDESVLQSVRDLLAPEGRVALYLGSDDAARLRGLPQYQWEEPFAIPRSHRRVILIGK
jgi:16S rRNA (guanine527-N7)-methyltransferase